MATVVQDWLPGVALDRSSTRPKGFWGVNSEKRGLAPVPFSKKLSGDQRVCHRSGFTKSIEVVFEGRPRTALFCCPLGALFGLSDEEEHDTHHGEHAGSYVLSVPSIGLPH